MGGCFPPYGTREGALVCQHGMTDGLVTTAWACAKSMTHNVAANYMPFVTCTSTRFLSITTMSSFRNVLRPCANVAGFNVGELFPCVLTNEGHDLLNMEARATI